MSGGGGRTGDGQGIKVPLLISSLAIFGSAGETALHGHSKYLAILHQGANGVKSRQALLKKESLFLRILISFCEFGDPSQFNLLFCCKYLTLALVVAPSHRQDIKKLFFFI
jgi:hypothetical protein